MSNLYARANSRQVRVLRIVEGAVRNAVHAHPEKQIDPRMARSIAKRAAGTLTAATKSYYDDSITLTCEVCRKEYHPIAKRSGSSCVCSRACNGERQRSLRMKTPAQVQSFITNTVVLNVVSGCWEWPKVNRHGYAAFKLNGKRITGHRASYIAYKGEIGAGLFVCHTCDNRSCCNPDHLFLGTPLENTRDMDAKGRGRRLGVKGSANKKSKLTEDDVRAVFSGCAKHQEIADDFGISKSLVSGIKLGTKWTHLGLLSDTRVHQQAPDVLATPMGLLPGHVSSEKPKVTVTIANGARSAKALDRERGADVTATNGIGPVRFLHNRIGKLAQEARAAGQKARLEGLEAALREIGRVLAP